MFTKAEWLIFSAAFLSFLFSVMPLVWHRNERQQGGWPFRRYMVPSILSAGNSLRQAARAKQNV